LKVGFIVRGREVGEEFGAAPGREPGRVDLIS